MKSSHFVSGGVGAGLLAGVLALFGAFSHPAPKPTPPPTTPPPVVATIEKTSPFDIGVALASHAIRPGFRLPNGALAYHTDVTTPSGKTLDVNENCAMYAIISRGKTGGQDHVGCDSGNVTNDKDFAGGTWKYIQDASGARMAATSGGSGSSPAEPTFIPPGYSGTPKNGDTFKTASGTCYSYANGAWMRINCVAPGA